MKIQPSKLEALSESWFRRNREEMAACLAHGETLKAFGKPLLTAEDLENRVYSWHDTEIRVAMCLCTMSPEVGGKHVKRILDRAALDLVNAFQDELRASYEEEINQKDAA